MSFQRLAIAGICVLMLAGTASADDGTMHPAYVRTIKARKPGLYFRVLSAITRGTPMHGPIPAPSNTNPRGKYYGYGLNSYWH